MIDIIKEIWQTMCTNKLRTFLTGLSVAWGIFMLILLLAIAKGVINSSTDAAAKNDPNRISVWGGYTSKPYRGLKEGRAINLKDDYRSPISNADRDKISAVDGEVSLRARISTNRDYLTSNKCRGVYPRSFNGRYKLSQGRYINEADLRAKRKSIMLHKDDLPILFTDTTDVVGKYVKVDDLNFTIVGVFDHEWNKDPCIPYTTAVALKGYSNDLDQIEVHLSGVNTDNESAEIEQKIKKALSDNAGFAPDDDSALYTFDRFASYIQQQTGLSILNSAMWVIGILTLITGIVGVSNIMFVSVRERTHEIGIRRAIGAKPRSILMQVVLESVALTTAFGYIGIVMGTLATEAVKAAFKDSQFMMNPQVDLSIATEVTIALIISGALAGLFPALKAIKVRPVEALRDE